MANDGTLFEAFLSQHDDAAWAQVISGLLPSMHPVDRAAIRIWFAFFPLKLHRALQSASDPGTTARELLLEGRYRLSDQVDSSAAFLYGHRYWPEVKRAVAEYATAASAPESLALKDQILEVARRTAAQLNADGSLLLGITAIAFMALQQVGLEVFSRPASPSPALKQPKTPDQVLKDREREAKSGLFSFLKTVEEFTVAFDELDPQAAFKVINGQDLTMAAATDKRDYRLRDPRCTEGPIPVECRSASCGSCWVGILSDTSKISAPGEREVKRMKEFGYAGFAPEQHSIIRLACQTRCHGNVSIVIPPWNGVIGKLDNQ